MAAPTRSDDPAAAGGSAGALGRLEVRSARRRAAVAVVAVAAVAGAAVWRWWLAGGLPAPVAEAGGVLAFVAVAVAGRAVAAAAGRRADRRRWLRGAEGERATAEVLTTLPRRRWVVLHDRLVPEGRRGWQVDHVVVGPTGVWVVDSKAYRAPLRAGWRRVRAGDVEVSTEGARRAAAALEAALDDAGADLPPGAVRAVLAVHGDGLPPRGRTVDGVPVVPAAGLVVRLHRRRGSAHLGRRRVRDAAATCGGLLVPAAPR